ncbi:MAG TPA: DUF1614 domain-containing protein [Terriglobales bacterium]|nr:DUF1614 domain-containing protein [Terriglobales bacterium]
MFQPGCLALLVVFFFVFLLPFFFAQFMVAALGRLGLSPPMALLSLVGIIFGSMINIPLKHIPHDEEVSIDPFRLYGFGPLFPRFHIRRTHTILAVNVGGCVVPCIIAIYEALRIAARGPGPLFILVIITLISVVVCYRIARPLPGIGIAMPAFIPPLIAAALSLILIPEMAPPVAFVSGVLGPLIGADLLHLKELKQFATGMASIGGAGTFDGIVLSGLIAAVLT